MVTGLELFKKRFREFEGSFILIGGAACDEWFTARGMEARKTIDLDLVLVIEKANQALATELRKFIDEGGYEIRESTEDGPPTLYRFEKPQDEAFPYMLELFTRRLEDIDIAEGQEITPVPIGEYRHSLSAILLDEDYYALLRGHHIFNKGLAVANATALIPMKALAWLDLTRRKVEGERVDSSDLKKHRGDVFRLAATLPGEPGPELADSIKADLQRFLDSFPENSEDWPAILASTKKTIGGNLKPVELIDAIRTYFNLTS